MELKMESRYTTYQEYLSFLYKIGRRFCHREGDETRSDALTIPEQSRLSALYLRELNREQFPCLLEEFESIWTFIRKAVDSFCNEETPLRVLHVFKMHMINCCYPQIQNDLQNFKEPDNNAA